MVDVIGFVGFCRGRRAVARPSVLLVSASLAIGVLGASSQALAAIQTQKFNAVRPKDGDLLNFEIHYDDSADFTSSVGALCGPDPSPPLPVPNPPPSSGCYVQNTSNGYLPGPVSPSFTGYKIVNVTGTYYDKVDDETFNVTGLFSEGSFEGGVGLAIPHYASDNLFDPVSMDQKLSGGGIVLATDNPAYQYHLFLDPVTRGYAGCGSGTCKQVQRVPGPLPVVGALAAFGFSRKVRRRSQLRQVSRAL